MSQIKAVYLTERYCAGDENLGGSTVADDLQRRAHQRAVGLLCELLLEELDGPISDLGRRVEKLGEEVGEMERAVNGVNGCGMGSTDVEWGQRMGNGSTDTDAGGCMGRGRG
jgi:hypothetical protein